MVALLLAPLTILDGLTVFFGCKVFSQIWRRTRSKRGFWSLLFDPWFLWINRQLAHHRLTKHFADASNQSAYVRNWRIITSIMYCELILSFVFATFLMSFRAIVHATTLPGSEAFPYVFTLGMIAGVSLSLLAFMLVLYAQTKRNLAFYTAYSESPFWEMYGLGTLGESAEFQYVEVELRDSSRRKDELKPANQSVGTLGRSHSSGARGVPPVMEEKLQQRDERVLADARRVSQELVAALKEINSTTNCLDLFQEAFLGRANDVILNEATGPAGLKRTVRVLLLSSISPERHKQLQEKFAAPRARKDLAFPTESCLRGWSEVVEELTQDEPDVLIEAEKIALEENISLKERLAGILLLYYQQRSIMPAA
jgi:hypothetical protein